MEGVSVLIAFLAGLAAGGWITLLLIACFRLDELKGKPGKKRLKPVKKKKKTDPVKAKREEERSKLQQDIVNYGLTGNGRKERF